VEEAYKYEVSKIEDHAVLKDFEDVFHEVPGLPPKRDIDFCKPDAWSSSSVESSLQ
jgi:hypothetical protein